MDRRTFLVLSAGTLPALAGCASDEGTAETTTTTEPATATQTTATATDTPTTAEPTDESTSEEPTTTEEGNSPTVEVGTLVEGDSLALVVESAAESDQEDGFPEPELGNVFVVVRLAVKNTTDGAFMDFDGFLDTQLRDAPGATYQRVDGSTPTTFEGGQLAPGEVASGALVYELPEDSSGLSLHFDFQAFEFTGLEGATIDLGSQAEPVADLEQTLHVPVHAIGDSVSPGEVTVSLNSIRFETDLQGDTNADAGTEYAVVDLTTANRSGENLSLAMPHLMAVKDGEGNLYARHAASASLDGAYPETGSLSPGESRRGTIAYGIPEGQRPVYWVVEFSEWAAGNKAFWQLR